MNLNLKLLIGRLGRDPEFRYTPNGVMVTTFNLATNSYYPKKSGDGYEEVTTWHTVKVFGKLAEYLAGKNLKKGELVFVQGEDRVEQWEDKNGIKRQMNYVRADRVVPIRLNNKQSEAEANIQSNSNVQAQPQQPSPQPANTSQGQFPENVNNNYVAQPEDAGQNDYDDLPF